MMKLSVSCDSWFNPFTKTSIGMDKSHWFIFIKSRLCLHVSTGSVFVVIVTANFLWRNWWWIKNVWLVFSSCVYSDHNMLVSDALETLCAGIRCESLSVRQPCERLNCQKRTFNHQSAYWSSLRKQQFPCMMGLIVNSSVFSSSFLLL